MNIYLVAYGVRCGDGIRTDEMFVLAPSAAAAKSKCVEYIRDRMGGVPFLNLIHPQEVKAIHAQDYSVELPDGTMYRNSSGYLHVDARHIDTTQREASQ